MSPRTTRRASTARAARPTSSPSWSWANLRQPTGEGAWSSPRSSPRSSGRGTSTAACIWRPGDDASGRPVRSRAPTSSGRAVRPVTPSSTTSACNATSASVRSATTTSASRSRRGSSSSWTRGASRTLSGDLEPLTRRVRRPAVQAADRSAAQDRLPRGADVRNGHGRRQARRGRSHELRLRRRLHGQRRRGRWPRAPPSSARAEDAAAGPQRRRRACRAGHLAHADGEDERRVRAAARGRDPGRLPADRPDVRRCERLFATLGTSPRRAELLYRLRRPEGDRADDPAAAPRGSRRPSSCSTTGCSTWSSRARTSRTFCASCSSCTRSPRTGLDTEGTSPSPTRTHSQALRLGHRPARAQHRAPEHLDACRYVFDDFQERTTTGSSTRTRRSWAARTARRSRRVVIGHQKGPYDQRDDGAELRDAEPEGYRKECV